MPVFRGPDGEIVEEPTTVRPPGGRAGDDASRREQTTVTRRRGADASRAPTPHKDKRYDDTTVVHRPGPGTATGRTARDADDERTQLAGGIPKTGAKDRAAEQVDPVTGWLVVMDGPGKGRDVRIGNGRNTLGREQTNRIALPFGDQQISRQKHLWITYDHLHHTFSVAPGDDSANLAHLNDVAIDARLPLAHGDTIRIGKTTLRFVAFCGADFHWPEGGE